MSVVEESSNDLVIFISGTPCTGKTTVALELNDFLLKNKFNSRLIKINDFAIERALVLDEDPDKLYKVIDIEKLNECLNDEIKRFHDLDCENDQRKVLIVEGHLSHLCEGADKMIVLRLDPNVLEKRLEERNYSPSKIHENLEAEALAVCSAEAYDIYGNGTNEIDTSNKSVSQIVDLIYDIAFEDFECPVGSIDFMAWILENS